jgi:hypothetical protein
MTESLEKGEIVTRWMGLAHGELAYVPRSLELGGEFNDIPIERYAPDATETELAIELAHMHDQRRRSNERPGHRLGRQT